MKRYKLSVGEAITGKVFRNDLNTRITELIKELGVEKVAEATERTVRTVQRWVAGTQKPRGDAASRLQEASDEFRKTKRWRRKMMPRSREKRLKAKGGQTHMNADCGPQNDSPGASIRERRFSWELTGPGLAAVIDAWLERGEEAARRALDEVLYWEYIQAMEYKPGTEEPNWGFTTVTLYGLEINHFHE